MAGVTLRPVQELAISMLFSALRAGQKRVVLKLPTGVGKTILAAKIIAMGLAKGRKVLFVVDAITLVDQTADVFVKLGLGRVGVIQAQHEMTDPTAMVQVCSVQTLSRRKYLPDANLVIVDECHTSWEFYKTWMDQWDAVPFVGLTATPYTKGMGKTWQHLVAPTTIREMIEDGVLCPFRVFCPDSPDLKGVRTVAGDYHEGDLEKAMNTDALVGRCVEVWKKLAENRPTLVFAVNIAHAKHIQREFISHGVPCGFIDAFTEIEERRAIGKEFNEKRLPVVVNVGTLTKGVDWDVRCIQLVRPTKSKSLFVQIIGRGLRTAEGKDYCLIIDQSSTHQRLGDVCQVDESETELDDGNKQKQKEREQKEKEAPLPTPCASCGYLKPPKTWACPHCGFAPEKQSEVEHVQGELVEFTGLSAADKRKAKLNKETPMAHKEVFLGELQLYAREKGYRPGWAANQYKEKFGVWPNKIEAREPKMVGSTTQDWIISRQIRWAKRKSA